MNRSFLQNSHIQVAIYDDRLENTSPGGLILGVTLERMKERYSKIWNRALANASSYMNLIEAWSGIPKLMKPMEDYDLREPEFIEMEISFRINLYHSQVGLNTNQDANQADRKTNQSTNQADQVNQVMDSLGREERQLVQLVVEKPEITQREMARQLGWSLGKVKYYITKLKKNHVLERAGSSQKGQWKALTEDNDKK